MPRVSVIIPTHERPLLLRRAVESAQAAGADIEVIVVDDASIDDTAEACQQLNGIKYVRVERNQGVAGARNIGILMSTAEYVAFLDDDDLRLPGSLDMQADLLDRHPGAGFVCGAMIMANQDYEPTGEVVRAKDPGADAFWKLLELEFPVMPLCALIRKECFLRVGLLNPRISTIDDWDIFTRIAELYSVLVTPEPVGIYRQPTPLSGQGSSARAAQLERVTRHQLNLFRLPRAATASPVRRKQARSRMIRRISENLVWTASTRFIPKFQFKPALRNVWTALRIDPFGLVRPQGYEKLIKHLILRTGVIRRRAI